MWQGEVYYFCIAGKSKRGNWWEKQFRRLWLAYVSTRVMAIICDLITPHKIIIKDKYSIEVQDNPLGIAWTIREI